MAVLGNKTANLRPCNFSALKGWEDDDHALAFKAFLVSSQYMQKAPYKTRSLGVDGKALGRVAKKALDFSQNHPVLKSTAQRFFEEEFVPHLIEPIGEESGFVTGFFEPLVSASLQKSDLYSFPLYQRPSELVDVDTNNRPKTMDDYFRFGRHGKNGIEEFSDRAAIQAGALEGRNLELVWLQNKVDVFFIHIQGSAKLALDNGDIMRVTYAAKTGHPYTSVAKVLCQQTNTEPKDMTADRLADWMRNNPNEMDSLLAHNQSYIFFKQVLGLDLNDGPIAAAKTPLIARRSLAVDRTLHTFGSPIWLNTTEPLPVDERPFAQLMFAHDTGSAIIGPGRGDIFTGTGEEAGYIAGKIRHAASMTILVPRT